MVGLSRDYRAFRDDALSRLPEVGSLARRLVDSSLKPIATAASEKGALERLHRALVLGPLRKQLGLSRLDVALATEGPLSDEATSFFERLAIDVRELGTIVRPTMSAPGRPIGGPRHPRSIRHFAPRSPTKSLQPSRPIHPLYSQ